MTEPTTPTGRRLAPPATGTTSHYRKNPDGTTTPLRDHSRADILAIEAEARQQERERLRAWHRQVREDWRAYWMGKDHPYARFATFLGERLRNDFELPEPDDRFIADPEPDR
jgi:hypothetical protein